MGNNRFFVAVLLLCLAVFPALPVSGCGDPPPLHGFSEAKRGIIDLTEFKPDSGATVTLDGEWEFYWKRLLSSRDISAGPVPKMNGLIRVPSDWNGRIVEGKPLDGNGYATYRLTLRLKEGTGPLALRLIDMRTAYTLFVNGKEIAANGIVGTSIETSKPFYRPVIASFSPVKGDQEILLQVSNFHHNRGGAFHSIHLGSHEAINAMRDRSFAFQVFMLGSLLIMALYHLGMYLIRRDDPSPLYLGLFCLIIAIRPMVSGEYLVTGLLPAANWNIILKTEYLTLYLGLPVFAMFMHSLFPKEFPKAVLRPLQVLGILFSLVVIASPSYIYTRTIGIYELITFVASLFTVYAVILAFGRKREGANVFLLGTIVLFITVVNEILYDNMLVNTGNFFPFGLFVFVLSQAFLLSLRFSRAFDNIETLSDELEESNRQLLRVDRVKDEFLANTSHELKTPLTAIIGIAESLMDGAAGTLPEGTRANLSLIVTSGRRLASLINDLLDFSRLKNSDIALNLKPVDIRTLAEMPIEITRHLKGTRPIEIVNSIPGDLPLIAADEDRMQQILINLLDNAIKFTDSGRVVISARVTDDGARGTSLMEVEVADTGIGIPADRLPFIFEPFEQADGSISRSHGGTGIGLSITRALIMLHGGEIEAASEPGRGSTFRFRIPLAPPAKAAGTEADKAAPPTRELPAETTFPMMQPGPEVADGISRILAVDDDPATLQVLKNQLSLHGYAVWGASGGTEALTMMESGLEPDMLILDVMMPKMSGLQVLRAVRERHSIADLPVLLLTAKGGVSDIATGLEAGANDYLAKPFDRVELLARVNTLTRLKTAVEENSVLTSLRKEMELAKRIQLGTVPETLPRLPGMDLEAICISMESIGGDFYDFNVVDDRRLGVFIADVSGHGVPAALIASMVKITFSILEECAPDPYLLMKRMNDILTGNIEHQFATAGYALIDRDTMKVTYARCGHEPLLLFKRRSRRIIEIVPEGKLIGFTMDNKCETGDADLEAGDRIILYTDGVTEACNDDRKMFGKDSLRHAIITHSDLTATEFAKTLTRLVHEWRGIGEQLEDDVTFVVVDILPDPAS
ncbi:MAG: SpoIIE family protein phosphatase [Spirochaetes bacterium]|nr:SpoIIE family protein phosphatase [Spirochaetota bacterium]